jgi:hypothetical protein
MMIFGGDPIQFFEVKLYKSRIIRKLFIDLFDNQQHETQVQERAGLGGRSIHYIKQSTIAFQFLVLE